MSKYIRKDRTYVKNSTNVDIIYTQYIPNDTQSTSNFIQKIYFFVQKLEKCHEEKSQTSA